MTEQTFEYTGEWLNRQFGADRDDMLAFMAARINHLERHLIKPDGTFKNSIDKLEKVENKE